MTDSRLTGCGRCMNPNAEVWKVVTTANAIDGNIVKLQLCYECAQVPAMKALDNPTENLMLKSPVQEPMFKLTEKERADLGSQLAQLEVERTAAEIEFVSVRKEHKERIDGLTEQIEKIAATINQSAQTE